LRLIIGIDPGKMTGMCLYDLDECKPVGMWEIPNGVKGFTEPFEELLPDDDLADIACEGFTLRSSNKFTADLSGVEIIGWLKGEGYCDSFPEPIQHMQLTRLRKYKDDYAQSPVTKLMKAHGFKIAKGHARMSLSVAIWHAAMKLHHIPSLELLKPKDS